MKSLDYHRAMRVLDASRERPWLLESAAHWVRVAEQSGDLSEQRDAEINLRRVLSHYEGVSVIIAMEEKLP